MERRRARRAWLRGRGSGWFSSCQDPERFSPVPLGGNAAEVSVDVPLKWETDPGTGGGLTGTRFSPEELEHISEIAA